MKDPIVDEVRRIREEHAAQFNYDIHAICEDIRRIAKESGQPRVSFGPKRMVTADSVVAGEPVGAVE